MTLVIYKKGVLAADSCSLVKTGHGHTVMVKDKKVFEMEDFAVGLTGEFDPDRIQFKENIRLLRSMMIPRNMEEWSTKAGEPLTPKQIEGIKVWCVLLGQAAYKYLLNNLSGAHVMAMTRTHALMISDEDMVYLEPHQDAHFALGSGARPANVALSAGKSVSEAFRICAMLDPYIRAPIHSIQQKKLKPRGVEAVLEAMQLKRDLSLQFEGGINFNKIFPIFSALFGEEVANELKED